MKNSKHRFNYSAYAFLLAFIMFLTLMPASVRAENEKGSIEPITQPAVVEEDTVKYSDLTLRFDPKDPSAGRMSDGYWIGVTIYSKPGMTEEELAKVKYGRKENELTKSFARNKDGKDTQGRYFMRAYVRVIQKHIDTALENGKIISYNYCFDWDGDGTTDQTFKIEIDPASMELTTPGADVHTHDTAREKADPEYLVEGESCKYYKSCSICGAADGSETFVKHSSELVTKNAKKATCTEEGYTGDEHCSLCDEIVKEGELIPAAGHKYDKEGVCTVCGDRLPDTVLRDEATGISVTGRPAVLSENLSLVVEPIDNPDKPYPKEFINTKAYDIYFTMNDQVYEIDGEVTVRIPYEAPLEKNLLSIYHADDNGLTLVDSVVEDDYVEFKASDFSVYVITNYIVETKPAETTAKPTAAAPTTVKPLDTEQKAEPAKTEEKAEVTKTGETVSPALPVTLLALAAVLSVKLILKKEREEQ